VQLPKKTDNSRNPYSLQHNLYYTEKFVQKVKPSGTTGEMIPATDYGIFLVTGYGFISCHR
jgi:hypothetical protein